MLPFMLPITIKKNNVAIVSTLFEDIILIGQWNLGYAGMLVVSVFSLLLAQSRFRHVVSVCVARDHQAILRQSSALLLASVIRVTGR